MARRKAGPKRRKRRKRAGPLHGVMSKLVVSIGHVEFTGGNQVLYVVKVQQDGDEWEVRRTFSDFRKLREDVLRVLKDARGHVVDDDSSRAFGRGVHALAFPSKRLFGSKKDHVVKERAVELHHFLIRLLVLTHTYRKAQKALYEFHSSHQDQQHHHATFAPLQDRTQASVSVFYLLRDFLKPVTLRTNVGADPASAGDGGRAAGAADRTVTQLACEDEEDEEAEANRRMIRESKMLAMSIGSRGSGPAPAPAPHQQLKASKSPAAARSKSHHGGSHSSDRHHSDAIPILEAPPIKSKSHSAIHDASKAHSSDHHGEHTSSKITSITAVGRSRSASRLLTPKANKVPSGESMSDGRKRQGSGQKTGSMSELAAQVERARTESYMLRDQLILQREEKQKQEREHEQEHLMAMIQETQAQDQTDPKEQNKLGVIHVGKGEVPSHHEHFKQLMDQHQKRRHHSSSSSHGRPKTMSHPPSSESSQTSESERDPIQLELLEISARLVTSASAGSANEAKHVLLTPEMTEKIMSGGSASGAKSPSDRRRARAKKAGRSKSTRDIQQRESERLSRVSTQLTAQSISVSAQKELEKFVSEYTAIMVLRYVDRFISKAVTKAPGCYRVDAATHKLVIDSERFVEELEDTFTDLPMTFPELFKDDMGEWVFPPALDAYAQLKWNSFHGKPASGGSAKGKSKSARRASSDNDSDSDSDYEYEQVGGGGYMKAKKDFSRDEESMLQEMIANGTAGRDQTLRLRRQLNERGWNRRENPGSRSQRVAEDDDDESEDNDNSSDTEEESDAGGKKRRAYGKSKSSCAVDQFQRQQNARRKDRLSRVQSVGGLV